MAPPARQSFGVPRPGPAPTSATQQFQPEPYWTGNQHTLIVSSGTDVPYGQPPPGYGPPEPRLQRLLFSRRLGYVAAALAVVLIAGLVTWWLTSGRYTTVPKITGMTVAAAKAELRDAGFTVGTGKALLDNHVAKGAVIRSVPATGQRVRKGSRITLIPSAGAPRPQGAPVTRLTPTVATPNGAGLGVGRATHILENLGFSVTVNQVGPLDTVIHHSPDGQAPKGSTITLWVGL